MSGDDLAKADIALVNLLCAQGLPGSEALDIPAVLKTLDKWAARVASETRKYYPGFLRNPAENNYSEADYRMGMLITVLQQDLGVSYNPARISQPDFKNSKDQFIHGMIGDAMGGTCVSMPVLYVAIGRRLGYPVKLVLAREHVFVRWDGSDERLNIEGTGRGMNTHPDEYYRDRPLPLQDQWIERGEFLKSLSPQEELAAFLASRGHCLNDNGRFAEARECYAAAARLHPNYQGYQHFVAVSEAFIAHRASGATRPLRLPRSPYGDDERTDP